MLKIQQLTDRVKFIKIISNQSTYGLIWSGTFDQQPCVIKMVALTSGIHYDKEEKKYINHLGQHIAKKKNPPELFQKDHIIPYLHTEFQQRKAMTRPNFIQEVTQLIRMNQFKIAPKVFGYGICDQLFAIHYGFIVMEKMDCSVKDILLKRDLNHQEFNIIKQTIDTMHKTHGMVHRDMKPSNIGVNLCGLGQIKKCLIFDCQKVANKTNFTSSQFNHLIERDWDIFHKHVKMNSKNN